MRCKDDRPARPPRAEPRDAFGPLLVIVVLRALAILVGTERGADDSEVRALRVPERRVALRALPKLDRPDGRGLTLRREACPLDRPAGLRTLRADAPPPRTLDDARTPELLRTRLPPAFARVGRASAKTVHTTRNRYNRVAGRFVSFLSMIDLHSRDSIASQKDTKWR